MAAAQPVAPGIREQLEQRLAALEPWIPALVEQLRDQLEQQPDLIPLTPEELQAEAEQLEAWLEVPTGTPLFYDPRLLENLAELQQKLSSKGFDSLQDLSLERIHDLADDLQGFWAMAEIAREAIQQGWACEPLPRLTSPRGLLVYGIGTGRYLARILNRAQADVVLIFEPDLQRLLAAFCECDLASLLPPYSGPGRGLYIITTPDTDRAFELASLLLCQTNLFVIDSLLVCECNPAETNQALRERFSAERNSMMLSYLGFFTDELHMLMNGSITFNHLGAFVLSPGSCEAHEHHAVVAVSGPSLLEQLPLLKAQRDRYTLFSGWSTLGTLLNAGIVPDFHCPMERHVVHDALQDPDVAQSLAGMALVGPSSLDSRQIGFYAERFLVFRSASTPSAVFAEHQQQLLDGEGPITVNMAALAAVLLGFRHLHFFGVDFGTTNLERKRNPDALLHTPYEFPHRETGVAGAEVFTNAVMLDARRAIERLLSGWFTPGEPISAWNFSGGLLIEGAPETDPARFSELLGQHSHRQTHRNLGLNLPRKEAHWAEQRWRVARLRERCHACLQTLRDLVEPLFSPATLLAISDFTDNISKPLLDQIPLRMYCGTVFRTWFSLWMLQRRLSFPDAAAEQAYQASCRSILHAVIDSLEALSFELFDYLEDLDDLEKFSFRSQRRP